jgi:multiple sugar transport system permease protein
MLFKGSLQSKKRRKMIADILAFVVLVAISVVVLLPIYWMFRSSVMKSLDIFLWPPSFLPMDTWKPSEWIWSNYTIRSANFVFLRNLKNSLAISIPCVVFGTATAVSCAYAFARLKFRGKKFLFALCVGSMLLPAMVTLIPLYMAWTALGFIDSYGPLILPYLCGGGAFNIFLLRQFIKTIPKELDEAAKIDGAGYGRTLVSVIVPSIKPAIIVVALLIFITTWNDLLQQLIYIQSAEKYTLVLGLTAFFGNFKADFAGMFAATILTFLPGLLIYIVGQRYFVEGIVMTGMKN